MNRVVLLLTLAALTTCAQKDAAPTQAATPAAPAAEPAGEPSRTAALAPNVPAGEYKMDHAHSTLLFRVSHMGFSKYTARFQRCDAKLQFDPRNLAATQLTATVDPRSISQSQYRRSSGSLISPRLSRGTMFGVKMPRSRSVAIGCRFWAGRWSWQVFNHSSETPDWDATCSPRLCLGLTKRPEIRPGRDGVSGYSTTATASISISQSGTASAVTPTSVLAGGFSAET